MLNDPKPEMDLGIAGCFIDDCCPLEGSQRGISLSPQG